MDLHSAPVPASHEPAKLDDGAVESVSAYYSLVFPTVTFYVRTLSVTIGRRCTNPNLPTSSATDSFTVDVDLGALKSVSRLHAKIEYDQDEDRFVLLVVGRNGAWVDGVWSASGTRAPLGERSQIQIASRTFHFVLPPPPPPEDTPSPSSQSSNNRPRSPSVDITSISPPSTPQSHSPPPIEAKLPLPPPLPEPQLPTPKPPAAKTNPKKRKKPDAPSPPKPKPLPVEIPEKPALTLRQLIQLAIKGLGGKGTLQEICTWIMNGYEHYQHVDDKWMSSVRHTLSSDKHFKKMERCGGTRGKGYFWSVAEDGDDQAPPAAGGSALPAGKTTKAAKGTKKKEKEKSADSSLKKSAKGGDVKVESSPTTDVKSSIAEPAAATAVPGPGPAPTLTAAAVPPPSQVTTGVFAYSTLSSSTSYPSQNPYASLTKGNWGASPAASTSATPSATPAPAAAQPTPSSSTTAAAAQPTPQGPDVSIPIILGPIPPSHPDYSPTHPNNSAKEGYMVLHERTLILDPDVFSGVDGQMLKELEKMGARKALGVLAGHMVRALKERRAARGRGRGRSRGRGLPKGRIPTAASMGGEKDKVPANVDAQPPVPVPVLSGNGRADSPLVVVDDSDGEDSRPAAKRRKLDDSATVAVDAMMG